MTLHLVTVRLDRVFDVVHTIYDRQEMTFFSFEHDNQRVFGVRAQGRHDLESGEVLTACLRQENDWSTLVGWYNHSTETIFVEQADMGFVIFTAVAAAVLLPRAEHFALPIWCMLFAMAAWSVRCICVLLFMRRVRSALKRVRADVPTRGQVEVVRFPWTSK